MAVFLFYDPADPTGTPKWDAHLPDDTALPLTTPVGMAYIQVPDAMLDGYCPQLVKVDLTQTPPVLIAST